MAARENAKGAASALLAIALWTPIGAGACECTSRSGNLRDEIEKYDFVFRSVVTKAEVVFDGNTYYTEIDLGEVLPHRGGEPPFRKLISHGESACGMPVRVPEDYWFFVNKDRVLSRCSMSSVASSDRVRQLELENLATLSRNRELSGIAHGYVGVERRRNRSFLFLGGFTVLAFASAVVFWLRRQSR